MSNDEPQLSIGFSELLKEIKCDQCQKENPPHRCSRCHLTYYCTVQCQKIHWKAHKGDCVSADSYNQQLVGPLTVPSSGSTNDATTHSKSCSICFSETIENPIVIPACRHTFCFSCLLEWHNYGANSFVDGMGPPRSQRGRCPCCLELGNAPIVVKALEKAQVYAAAGRLDEIMFDYHLTNTAVMTPLVTMNERKTRFCRLAMDQVNKVLVTKPTYLNALCFKGQILRHVKPQESIDALNKALRIDQEGIGKEQRWLQLTREIRALSDQIPSRLPTMDLTDQLNLPEFVEHSEEYNRLTYEREDGWKIGDGPYRLYYIKIWLAEAHEGIGKYTRAKSIYNDMMQVVFRLGFGGYQTFDNTIIRLVLSGASRCFYHSKDYLQANAIAQSAIGLNRHFYGVHALSAQSQWAMNRKQDAIRTMCRGVLYETTWNKLNYKRNRLYLQVLIDAERRESEGE